MKRLVLVALFITGALHAGTNIYLHSTFEKHEWVGGEYPWNTLNKWVREPDNDDYVRMRAEGLGYQTQRHGSYSLRIYDPDNTHYANATHTFPTITEDEYMTEFYFYLPSDAVSSIDNLYLYGPRTNNWNVYTTSNLPNNNVQAVAVDNNGNIWVGTNGGLAKFDGST